MIVFIVFQLKHQLQHLNRHQQQPRHRQQHHKIAQTMFIVLEQHYLHYRVIVEIIHHQVHTIQDRIIQVILSILHLFITQVTIGV
jgi:hypothetical protein